MKKNGAITGTEIRDERQRAIAMLQELKKKEAELLKSGKLKRIERGRSIILTTHPEDHVQNN